MAKLKIALSILALLVLASAGITSFGNWLVPPYVSELFGALGMMLAWLGYQPFTVPAQVSRVFAVVSVMAAGFVSSHAATWGDGHKHVWIIVVAFVGAVMGSLARGLPTARPVDPPPPKPSAERLDDRR